MIIRKNVQLPNSIVTTIPTKLYSQKEIEIDKCLIYLKGVRFLLFTLQ